MTVWSFDIIITLIVNVQSILQHPQCQGNLNFEVVNHMTSDDYVMI